MLLQTYWNSKYGIIDTKTRWLKNKQEQEQDDSIIIYYIFVYLGLFRAWYDEAILKVLIILDDIYKIPYQILNWNVLIIGKTFKKPKWHVTLQKTNLLFGKAMAQFICNLRPITEQNMIILKLSLQYYSKTFRIINI